MRRLRTLKRCAAVTRFAVVQFYALCSQILLVSARPLYRYSVFGNVCAEVAVTRISVTALMLYIVRS